MLTGTWAETVSRESSLPPGYRVRIEEATG